MVYPPGMVNVWKVDAAGTIGRYTSRFTAHFVSWFPYGPDDTADDALDAFILRYTSVISNCCAGLNGLITVTSRLVLGQPAGGVIAQTSYFPPTTPAQDKCPEAAFLIRRVGAGASREERGRMRIGPLTLDLFSDAPRYRKIVNTDPRITENVALIQFIQDSRMFPMEEVLYNRYTGVARSVEHYSVPTRTGRVWQRAGYPQGRRNIGPI